MLFIVAAGGCHRALDPACNPLVGDDCLTPFPSSFYLAPDAASATGLRVHIPNEALPLQSGNGGRIRPDRLNRLDGFSPSTPFLVYFKAGVDASQPPGADAGQSTSPSSSGVDHSPTRPLAPGDALCRRAGRAARRPTQAAGARAVRGPA